MTSDPVVFEGGGCPVCGGDIMAEESADGGFADGEPCYCASNCGWHGCISADEDGAWVQANDDVEALVRVIEDQRIRLIRARDHLLRIWPKGKDCEHADARQVFMALEDPS